MNHNHISIPFDQIILQNRMRSNWFEFCTCDTYIINMIRDVLIWYVQYF